MGNENLLERLAPPTVIHYARDLSTVTNALRDALTIAQALFPWKDTDSLTYEYWIGEQRREVMATFQPFDVPASIASRRPPGAPVRGDIPKIARKVQLLEKESIILDRVKQNAALPSDVRALVNAQYDDITRMRNSVLARFVKAVLEGVATGVISIQDENGMTLVVNFMVPADQKETLTGTDLWSDPTADIYAKEMEWISTMRRKGKRVSRVLTSERVVENMLNNEKMRDLILGRNYNGAPLRYLTRAELDSWRAAQGLPRIVTLDAQVDKELADGTFETQRYFPENKYVLLPADKLGDSLRGQTAEARMAARNGVINYSEVTGIWAGTWEVIEPPSQWTKAAMLGFPTFPGAEEIFQADVLA